jgi:hypothetical protein
MAPDSSAASEIDLYGDIFRCESCSNLTDVHGVASFAARGPDQTIPVSHFGDISRSALWLILNNPKGDRRDAAVGASPRSFGASTRAALSTASITSVKKHFDHYFQPGARISEFFRPWIDLLDGLRLDGEALNFSDGRICAVDLIKCPTRDSWMSYVMTPEGKRVWENCLRHDQGNRFLLRQIDFHQPRILLFAGTQRCVGRNWRGSANRGLNALARQSNSLLIKSVWTLDARRRVSIGLASQRVLDRLGSQLINVERQHLQKVLDAWAP